MHIFDKRSISLSNLLVVMLLLRLCFQFHTKKTYSHNNNGIQLHIMRMIWLIIGVHSAHCTCLFATRKINAAVFFVFSVSQNHLFVECKNVYFLALHSEYFMRLRRKYNLSTLYNLINCLLIVIFLWKWDEFSFQNAWTGSFNGKQ